MICRIILCSLILSFNWSLATAQREYIVTVNSTTGLPTKIDSIPGVIYLQSGAAYNQTTKEYTVMGTFSPGQSPVYLYTLNAVTGTVISKPALNNSNRYICFQYSRTTGILYAGIIENGKTYIATINKITGVYTLLKEIPGIVALNSFVIDEENQRLYLYAVDNNPNFAIWTIDLATGNIIYHVSAPRLVCLQYDNAAHKLHALTSRLGPGPLFLGIYSICTVNPVAGTISNIIDLPGVTGVTGTDNCTFNENEHLFLFTGIEQAPPVSLYTVNVTTGTIISKPAIASSGVINKDNLIFYRYDNNSSKLYGLLWEANTVSVPPVIIDSTCRLDSLTSIYPNPVDNILVVNKKPTTCHVSLNLYNAIGQLVLRNKLIADGRNDIQLPNLAPGIYYYECIANNKALLRGRIVKRH